MRDYQEENKISPKNLDSYWTSHSMWNESQTGLSGSEKKYDSIRLEGSGTHLQQTLEHAGFIPFDPRIGPNRETFITLIF